jgi:hypothetical protein
MPYQRPEFSCGAPIMHAARERSEQAASAASAVSYNSSLDGRQSESWTLPVVLLALLLEGDSKVIEGTTHAESQERLQ